MKVEKIVITKEKIDLDITGATLLSIEEYKEARPYISIMQHDWWLRSPGYISDYAACVYGGYPDVYGYYVGNELAVRPALKIKSSVLQVGDKIEVAGHTWTIILKNIALCDDIIGDSVFRTDWEADNVNKYEASDIKKYVDTWFAKYGC